MEISTSVLSVKEENAVQTFYDIEVAKTDYFHIDVMDGKFVEQDTSKKMLEYAQTITHISNVPLDVHLMVQDVERYIEDYLPFHPAYITLHYESVKEENLKAAIQKIKEAGVKVGLCIKPQTSVKEIKPYLPYVNLVLVMTVEPGYGGQQFMPENVQKIQILKEYAREKEYDYYIEADGGINEQTIGRLQEAGCDIAVVGTAIIQAENKKEIIKKLKEE